MGPPTMRAGHDQGAAGLLVLPLPRALHEAYVNAIVQALDAIIGALGVDYVT